MKIAPEMECEMSGTLIYRTPVSELQSLLEQMKTDLPVHRLSFEERRPPGDNPISEEASWKQRQEDGILLPLRPIQWILRVVTGLRNQDDIAVFGRLEIQRRIASGFGMVNTNALLDNVDTFSGVGFAPRGSLLIVSFGVHDELRVECFGTTQARMKLQAR